MERREFLTLLLGAAGARAVAQEGMASRHLAPSSMPKTAVRKFDARLIDVAASAGLTQVTVYGGIDHKEYIVEANGCGCAFLDYDNDGWIDIFILSGTRLDGNPAGATNRLYKNNRDGTFTDVTEAAGLQHVGWANSVCVGDYNNDGFEDLFCTYYGQNRLYRNNGNGTFSDVTRAAGLWNPDDQPRWGAGCSFIDYDADGRLDLFVSNYIQFDLHTAPKPGEKSFCMWKGHPVNCGPRGLKPGTHHLYHNNGDGTFTDVSEKAGIASKRDCYGMTVVAADFDEDGWPDIFVACDSSPSFLFMNNHDGTFREEGVLRGVSLSSDGMEQANMGVGIGDTALSGHLDLFLTHFAEDTSTLYRNDGKANFDDVTIASHFGSESRYITWGTGIVDLDNDGLPDIFSVTGSVYPELVNKLPGWADKTPRLLFRNLGGGVFEEVTDAGPGLVAVHSSRGCAFGDFDNDGDMDILIINMNEPPSLLRNDLQGNNHWIKVKLTGTKSNCSAIGARVVVRYGNKIQAQSVVSQSSYYSVNDSRLHFGLGQETAASIEIHWPSGLFERLRITTVDELLHIVEGRGLVAHHAMSR